VNTGSSSFVPFDLNVPAVPNLSAGTYNGMTYPNAPSGTGITASSAMTQGTWFIPFATGSITGAKW
jgi:hypothetical protein